MHADASARAGAVMTVSGSAWSTGMGYSVDSFVYFGPAARCVREFSTFMCFQDTTCAASLSLRC